MIRALRLLTLALAAVGATPSVAGAHSIGRSAADDSVLEFVPLGIEHMLLGWDHLLFIAGVVLLAGDLWRAAKLISLFVLGHSTTLIVATLAGWRIDPTLVDVVIALSVVFVGVVGLRGRPENWRVVGAVIFGFGLVHGLGLSTRLQDLGLPEDGLLPRVIAFNVGVEIGQLAAIVVMVGIGWLAVRLVRGGRFVRPAFALLTAAGLVAAAVLTFPGDEGASSESVARAAGVTNAACEVDERNPPEAAGAGHPARQFYLPDDPVDEAGIGHVVGDGFVIVRYRPDLPQAQVDALQSWIDGRDQALIGAPAPGQREPVRAYTALRTLRCSSFDVATVRSFAETWLQDVLDGELRDR